MQHSQKINNDQLPANEFNLIYDENLHNVKIENYK